jgi:glycine/D-amino acid oxidase-like deaminating enzyme/nitrite reductase/ring-hydroxylating ferredoxin subunit
MASTLQSLAPKSYWIDSAPLPRFPSLERDVSVDVAVIGGGITGITAAYLLKRAGKKVALLERERCARIDTGNTTAHLTAVTDLRLQDIARTFGSDAARAVWDAGHAAIDQIVTNIRAEDIGCDFRWVPGYLHAPLDGADHAHTERLQREAELARALGIEAEFIDPVPAVNLPGVKFAHQALFHPRKYLAALAQAIPGEGSHVFENSAVSGVEEEPLAVKVGDHAVRCDYLVIATHTPLMGLAGTMGAMFFQSKLALYTSYALGARLPHDKFPEASWWDTSDPYCYLRVERHHGFDYAIFGGEDHKTGQEPDTEAPYRRLEQKFLRLVPTAEIDHRWSGQVIETNDGLPFIGEFVERQFAATGFGGNGMTFGTIGGMMATDAVLKHANPWTDLFDPGRKKLRGGAWNYVTENIDYPYFLVRDRLARAEAKSLRALKSNQGKILSLDGQKVAAFRDEKGRVTLCSPVCTHLKCIFDWNEAEHTWDCPCHGSRFKPTGEVISGPAEEPLEKLPNPKEK